MLRDNKAIIYARCSTSHHDQNPEVQLQELRRYCKARELEIIDEISDHGYTGKNDKRPGLKKLMSMVRAREADVIVIVKLDRLFRSLKHLVVTLQEFYDLGIKIIAIKDQIDSTTAHGKLMIHMIGAFSEFEASLIRERTIAGVEYARSKGKLIGRPTTVGTLNDEILELRANGLT